MKSMRSWLLGLALAATAGRAPAAERLTSITSETFEQPPPAAQPKPGSSCMAAQEWITRINTARFSEVGGLFAQDAIFIAPNGRVIVGQSGITEYYASFASQARPTVIPLSFISHGPECFMEVASHRSLAAKFSLSAANHFTVDKKGRIERLIVYVRPRVVVRPAADPAK